MNKGKNNNHIMTEFGFLYYEVRLMREITEIKNSTI